jgi:hypothetical protein
MTEFPFNPELLECPPDRGRVDDLAIGDGARRQVDLREALQGGLSPADREFSSSDSMRADLEPNETTLLR